MAFAITDGTVTLMSDFPYEVGYVGAPAYDPANLRSSTATTLALITHRHRDHWEPTLFAKTNWKIVGPSDVTSGIAADRVVPLSPRITFGPIEIEPLETPHARIGHFSYVVTWHGRRLYFTGDTDSVDRLIATRNLDVAFVSPWLYQSVIKRGARPYATRIVIYHHEVGEQIRGCAAECTVPRQGETLAF